MSINNDHNNPDTPQDWERFSRMLQEHGEVPPAAGFQERLQEGWDASIAQRKRSRLHRKVLSSFAGVAMLVGICIVAWPSGVQESAVMQQLAEPQVQLEQADIFANPDIPPVWFDTTLPDIEIPSFPDLMESGHVERQGNAFFSGSDSLYYMIEEPVTGE